MVCPPTLSQAGMGGGLLHVIRTPEECVALLGVTHGVCIGCPSDAGDGLLGAWQGRWGWLYGILAVGDQSSNRPAVMLCLSERPFLGRC